MDASDTKLRAQDLIREIPDFPSPGIRFKDITPVLGDPLAFREIIDQLSEIIRPINPDIIVGIESRGFIFGTPVAIALGKGFVPIRKPGKLPYEVIREEYALEYGTNTVEMHSDAIKPGESVVIIDDLLATSGTAKAAINLVERLGGVAAAAVFVIELEFLAGRRHLSGYRIESLIRY